MSMPLPKGIRYHQKAVLIENISRYIRDVSAQSLLDIGAGTLETALPLSNCVRRYDAIERDPDNAARLADARLNVTQGEFPLPIDDTYDLVLSSHSVPENDVGAYRPFLSSAWRLTSPRGMLLVVTFKGHGGDLAQIDHELLGRARPRCEELESILHFFEESGGVVKIERVNSFVEAATAADIVRFLETWLSRDQEVRETIHRAFVNIIEARYKVHPGLFVFPTEHLFLSCRRQ